MNFIKRYLWTRATLFVILTAVMTWFGLRGLTIEQDILHAVASQNADEVSLFKSFEKRSVYKDKIFILVKSNEELAQDGVTLSKLLEEAGYAPYDESGAAGEQTLSDFFCLVPFFFPEGIDQFVSSAALGQRVDLLARAASLPGGGALLTLARKDPFGLASAMRDAMLRQFTAGHGAPVALKQLKIYARKAPLDYGKIGPLYHFLQDNERSLAFIGGDLFAYENYAAVNHDINWVVWLSLVLNLALFFYFCPYPRMMLFLAGGTLLSYAGGLCALRFFYPYMYAIVIVFTSTFVGFNNEYLVHFSGLKREHIWRHIIGLGSAIGTTLIGFVVLLFTKNEIIRQIALTAIGGMVGFVVLMLAYQGMLGKVSYRTFSLPSIKLGTKQIALGWLLILVIIGALGSRVRFATDIHDFQHSSSMMARQSATFEKMLDTYGMGRVVAVKVEGQGLPEYWQKISGSLATDAFHPMAFFQNIPSQQRTISQINSRLVTAAAQMNALAAAKGIRFEPDLSPLQSLAPLDAGQYLDLWEKVGLVPYSTRLKGALHLFVVPRAHELSGAPPMSPVAFYNRALTGLQNNLTLLFVIGLGVMFLYLVPLQRKFVNVLYIFLPLGLAVAILLGTVLIAGKTVNFMHIVGLALIISLALDYSCIAVSSGFCPHEQSKVALTGLSTITTFGILMFCSHPVMRDLGVVVTLGAAAALGVALFIRIDGAHEGEP